jgi:hypothetical protein
MGTSTKPKAFPFAALLVATLLDHGIGRAATQPVDLDALPANGAESMCSTDVLQTFPVKIQNKVTNRSNGDAFTFAWPSAGPGGFTSSVTAGTTNGVGAIWVWTTDQSVIGFTGNSCPTDACFAKTSGPDALGGFCSDACLADGTALTVKKGATAGTFDLSWTGGTSTFTVYRGADKIGVVAPTNSVGTTNIFTFTDTPPASASAFYVVRGVDCTTRKACATDNDCSAPSDGTCVSRGPFGVPGRSLFATDVTVSAASLTSSLITFFSPPHEVFRATSSTNAGGASETLSNFSTSPVTVTVPAFPPGCCPADAEHPHRLRCGNDCVDYLTDPNNCGSCGNICGDGTCCANGNCVSICGFGQTFCDGACVDLQDDDNNCGACGNACGESGCCSGGACHALCGEGLSLCGENCVNLDTDNENCGSCSHACDDGTCCDDGGCASLCPVGWTWYGGHCVDFRNDSANCGAGGHVCDPGSCCNNSACASVCPSDRVWCNGRCVSLNFDPTNCGACGNDCGKACCTLGSCDFYDCPYDQLPPIDGTCPNEHPTDPMDGVCPGSTDALAPSSCPGVTVAQSPAGECSGEFPPPSVEEAPICVVNESTTTIPPGESATTCHPGGPLFMEVPTAITVCGDGLPGVNGVCNSAATHITTGTFNRLMPHPTAVPGNAFVTPFAVHVVNDTSGDGLIEPGESAGLLIELLNAGSMNITGAMATLQAPAKDLTGDGVFNPVGITIGTAAASFGTIPGITPSTGCVAPKPVSATNAAVFPITVPPNHPGDTSHPLVLAVTGTVNGGPFSMNVPLSLGIADNCDPASGSGDFDGLDGLLTPMAKLVPDGDTVPFPAKAFNAGDTRPLKLRVGCGGVNVTSTMIDPPKIVGISEATRGPIDITFLNLNADQTSTSDDFFYMDNDLLTGPHWQYNLSTEALGTGTFTITIRIGGRKDYVTGFVLD